jgi:hypothetical protein
MLDQDPGHGLTHQRIGAYRRLILFFRGGHAAAVEQVKIQPPINADASGLKVNALIPGRL